MQPHVPAVRVRPTNDQPVREGAEFVLYWMTAARRTSANFALDHAVNRANELGLPLLVFEALRAGHRWANDRTHAFVLAGMADNREACADAQVGYYPYVEPQHGAGQGLLQALADRAALVVTDDFPCYFLPRMLDAFSAATDLLVEAVDSNGLFPMRAAQKTFARAYDFRRYLQRELQNHRGNVPSESPLSRLSGDTIVAVPDDIRDRWPEASEELLAVDHDALAELEIDHSVPPSPVLTGGSAAAHRRLVEFVAHDLERYGDNRNHPDSDASSRLSPWLHFGHIGTHEIVAALPEDNPGFESFFDELITWRELGYNRCHRESNFDRYESLPEWARRSLAEHADDERPYLYSLEELDAAATHDDIWNAAQRELVRHGRMHNYLRMLWGKKILEWSPSPQVALDRLIELNNRYALDGRNPNSYSGILWCLGLYDRAWGPERPVFGKIRFMTSDSTKRKLKMKGYLMEFGTDSLFASAKP